MSFFSITSDSELKSELAFCLKNRSLEQKFLYHGKGVDLYYRYKKTLKVVNEKNIDLTGFGIKNCFNEDKENIIISLGCGDSTIENNLYLKAINKYKIIHIGVDISKEMLILAEKKLSKIDVEKHFICADFSSIKLKNEIFNLTKKHENGKKIFAFFSNTFGNINHTHIIDTLYEMLDKGDQIWMDVMLRKSNGTKDNMDIFHLIDISDEDSILNGFMTNVFTKNNIPKENGFISKNMSKENNLNSLKLEFYFNFREKTKIDINGQITFLPGEQIKCLQIYFYDEMKLIDFFKEHGFIFIKKDIDGMRGQFLFEKE